MGRMTAQHRDTVVMPIATPSSKPARRRNPNRSMTTTQQTARQPLIRRWETQGIPGGWSISWTYQGVMRRFDGSPKTIPNEIEAWLTANRSGITAEQIWAECNRQWLASTPRSRWLTGAARLMQHEEPLRTGDPADRGGAETASAANFGPERWGPSAWGFLHHFGALERWTEAAQAAWDLVTSCLMVQWLDPEQNPRTGCSECLEEYRDTLTRWPPEEVASPQEAAQWSHRAHNKVRHRQGKTLPTIGEAGRLHGWEAKP